MATPKQKAKANDDRQTQGKNAAFEQDLRAIVAELEAKAKP